MSDPRYFARCKAFNLPPGPWKELSADYFAALQKKVKVTKASFEKGGVEAITVSLSAETYRHVYPELYQLLKEEQ